VQAQAQAQVQVRVLVLVQVQVRVVAQDTAMGMVECNFKILIHHAPDRVQPY
jgi:hypothetical protein